jgi:hypothetical protein
MLQRTKHLRARNPDEEATRIFRYSRYATLIQLRADVMFSLCQSAATGARSLNVPLCFVDQCTIPVRIVVSEN